MIKKISNFIEIGDIVIKLSKIMNQRHISIYEMSVLCNIKYDIIKKYYYGDITMLSIETLTTFCYVLNCNVSDLLEYRSVDTIVHQ